MIEYAITEHPFGKRLSAKGRIDALSSPEIQAVLMTLIMDGARTVLIDLSGVNYISSAGLRLFLSTQKQMQKVGGEILLIGLLPQVLDVFKMKGSACSGLSGVVETHGAMGLPNREHSEVQGVFLRRGASKVVR
jgi:anti-sigma B factor antagonist/stage II sporulation protein AA (anti-sigma F factor antagonist)